jgi:hypothetical protein
MVGQRGTKRDGRRRRRRRRRKDTRLEVECCVARWVG